MRPGRKSDGPGRRANGTLELERIGGKNKDARQEMEIRKGGGEESGNRKGWWTGKWR